MGDRKTKSLVTVVPDEQDSIENGVAEEYKCRHRIYDSHAIVTSEILEGFFVVCFTSNINRFGNDVNPFVDQLKKIATRVESFTDPDECIDYLTDIADKKVLMIMNDCHDDDFLSVSADIPQICSIYLFDATRVLNRPTRKKIKKLKGVHHDVEEICHSIQQDMHRQWVDSTPLSIFSVSSPGNLDALNSSFMYTQLLREILVDMEYDGEKARKDFVEFCRQRYSPWDCPPDRLDLFERTYKLHSPIWWYTAEGFVYANLNKALRTQDTELIMKMGFYIQDLYREAERRRSEMKIDSKMIVYRGQGLSDHDFEKLRDSTGGLLSFNSFLSTSRGRDVSLMYAEDVRDNRNSVGILFEMKIGPSIASSTFLSLDGLSQFSDEEEILFLMHSVFRISESKKLEERLWQVNLTLTDDTDQELNRITHSLRDEILTWYRWDWMGMLMQRLGKGDKALEIHSSMLQTTSDDDAPNLGILRMKMAIETGTSYLTLVKDSAAISYFETALEISQRYLSPLILYS